MSSEVYFSDTGTASSRSFKLKLESGEGLSTEFVSMYGEATVYGDVATEEKAVVVLMPPPGTVSLVPPVTSGGPGNGADNVATSGESGDDVADAVGIPVADGDDEPSAPTSSVADPTSSSGGGAIVIGAGVGAGLILILGTIVAFMCCFKSNKVGSDNPPHQANAPYVQTPIQNYGGAPHVQGIAVEGQPVPQGMQPSTAFSPHGAPTRHAPAPMNYATISTPSSRYEMEEQGCTLENFEYDDENPKLAARQQPGPSYAASSSHHGPSY